MRTFLEVGDTAYWPKLLDPFSHHGKKMTVIDRNKIRRSYNRRDPRYHQVIYCQYLLDGLMDNLVSEMHKNVEDDWDNLIVISGDEGVGKSNLAYHLCKSFDPDFNVEDGLIYEYSELVKRISDNRIKGKVVWIDEATLSAGKRDWQKDENKELIKILETYRSYGITIVMCIPQKDRLDVYIREDRLRYHLKALKMGWESDTEKKRGYYQLEDKKGVTMGYGKFPKMPPAASAAYERIKSEHQQMYADKLVEKIERKENGGNAASRWIEIAMREMMAAHDAGMSWEELSAIHGIPASTLRRQACRIKREQDD